MHSEVWFKVAESGKSSSGVWAATDLINNNGVYSFTIPNGLKPGQYIIRYVDKGLEYHTSDYLIDTKLSLCTRHGHILVLRCILLAHRYGFWPLILHKISNYCSKVQITGSGTRFPTSFVSFPGAYSGSTPGIVYDVYTNTGSYPIPGPNL